MHKPFPFIIAFACAVTLAFAQTEGPSSPGPAAKITPAPTGQNEATPAPSTPPQNNAGADGAASAPATAAPSSTATPIQATRKPASEDKASAGKPAADAPTKAYIIGPLDVLMVRVWNQQNLSGTVTVSADGMISMQLIGEIKAAGLTATQLRDVITQRLKDCCVNNPEGEVNVEVLKNNSKFFYVYGGVVRGGEFPLDRDTTVMDALSLVGGFKEFANKKNIRILRGAQTFVFNYVEVSKGKHLEQNILLQNGDRIFVKE